MSQVNRNSTSFWKLHRQGARLQKALFRATKGRVGATFLGAPVLLLDHVGRRSGTARTNPLIYLDDEPDLVVVASKGGSDAHPAWFHNLMAMPVTEVELRGGTRRRVRPRLASGAERAALWPRLVEVFPSYADYAGYTEREIQVVVLEPADRTTRHAVVQHGYGTAGAVLSSAVLPIEPPSPTQVRVRVHAASVNPVDWQMVEGHRRLLVRRRFPFVPLFDLAGVVTAVGSEVGGLRVGDRVHADNKLHGGGAAEYVNVEHDLVSVVPAGLSLTEAAAVPLAGQTALLALDEAGIRAGSRVVVIGASGGVGTYAVQMAKALGAAHVTAVSSGRNADFVRGLGADDVVDHTAGRFDSAVPAGSADAVLDLVGGREQWEAARNVLVDGGRFVTISRDEDDRVTPGSALRVGASILARRVRSRFGRRIAYVPVFLDASRALLDRVDRMIDSGQVRVHVDRTYGFTLDGVVAALDHSKRGRTVGKVVVEVVRDEAGRDAAPSPG